MKKQVVDRLWVEQAYVAYVGYMKLPHKIVLSTFTKSRQRLQNILCMPLHFALLGIKRNVSLRGVNKLQEDHYGVSQWIKPQSSEKYQTKMKVGKGQVLLIPLVPLVVGKKESV